MGKQNDTLVILTPAFSNTEINEEKEVMPSQQNFVRAINTQFPLLKIIIFNFHFPIVEETEYKWHGNQIFAFNGRDTTKKGEQLILWGRILIKLNKIRKSNNLIGLLSFFCSESAFIGHYFARYFGIKHLIWILGQDAKQTNTYIKYMNLKAEELIAISDFIQTKFEQSHKIRPKYVIPIGINPDLFQNNQVKREIDVIGVGSHIPLKQYEIFIEVVNELKFRIPNIKALQIGSGIETEMLCKLVLQLNLKNECELVGSISNAATLNYMQQGKIFIHTSNYEGFSMACLEALYAGCHIISFCKPMNSTIKNWHIVSTKDEMVTKALELLSSTEIKYLPELPYNINDMAKQLVSLYSV